MGIKANITTNKIGVAASGRQGVQGATGDTGATGPQGPGGSLTDQLQLIYVSKVGNDSNSGLNAGIPKLTITAAVTAAAAMTPTESNQITIQIFDAGTYQEAITLPEWVHIFGPNAGLDGLLDVSNNCIVNVRRLENTLTSTQCVKKADGGGLSKVSCALMIVAPNQQGVRCFAGQIGLTIGTMTVDDAEGLVAQNGSRITYDIQYVLLQNGSDFLKTNLAGVTSNSFYGQTLRVEDDGTSRFLVANAVGDMIDVQAGSVAVNMLYDLGTDTILNLYANTTTGTRVDGTNSQANIMDLAGNSNLQGDLKIEGTLSGPTIESKVNLSNNLNALNDVGYPAFPIDGQALLRVGGEWVPFTLTKGNVGLDDTDDLPEGSTNLYYPSADATKLLGIEALAEVNNISDVNATDLTDAGDSTLHFHSSDRNRANHTGTQSASTISDFDTEVSNNTSVTANTAKISYTDSAAVALNTAKNTYPSADATKLLGIAALAQVNTIDSGDNVSLLVNDAGYLIEPTTGKKYINSLGDLSAFLVSGTYELPPGFYQFNSNIDFGTADIKLMDLNGCYFFRGLCVSVTITYTGTSPFVTDDADGIILQWENMFVDTPNSAAFNLNNAGNSLIIELVVFLNTGAQSVVDGYDFLTTKYLISVGSVTGFLANDVVTISCQVPQYNNGQNIAGVYLTVSGAASRRLTVSDVDSRPESNECMWDILANYGGLISMTGGVHSTSGGDYFAATSRDQSDPDISVNNIKNVQSSSNIAFGFQTGNALVTTITTSSVPVKINAVWGDSILSRFTVNANGTWTYIGTEDISVLASLICTVDAAGGGTKTMSGYLALNGTFLPTSKGENAGASGIQISAAVLMALTTNDTIEVFVANDSDTSNLTVTTSTVNIAGGR